VAGAVLFSFSGGDKMSRPTNPIVIIPARLASSRLPGKPLADIGGEPMIVHVWRRALESGVGPVVVACADAEIAAAIEAVGGQAALTRADHTSGSDRVFEAVRAVDPHGDHDVVVNLQGDLPLVDPRAIRVVLEPLSEAEVAIATLACEVRDKEEAADPNVVKVVLSLAPGETTGRALYFSRAPVPCGAGPLYHHIGLYAYRRPVLTSFVNLPDSPLERREELEQLRALEAGLRIDVALVDTVPFGVDTPADLDRARAILAREPGGLIRS
jgi:3-deoxy-manno-octulosonate cytidylyltransferase (CMP-KDO synthetase)